MNLNPASLGGVFLCPGLWILQQGWSGMYKLFYARPLAHKKRVTTARR